jgi:hypothetical protein
MISLVTRTLGRMIAVHMRTIGPPSGPGTRSLCWHGTGRFVRKSIDFLGSHMYDELSIQPMGGGKMGDTVTLVPDLPKEVVPLTGGGERDLRETLNLTLDNQYYM